MFLFLLIALSVFALLVNGQSYPLVPVLLNFEAGCPSCQDYMTTTLADIMNKPDIVSIMDLTIIPYGNTKYNNGVYTCQHGQYECDTDVIDMCLLWLLSGKQSPVESSFTTQSKKAYPFIECMDLYAGNPDYAEACFSKTMTTSGVTWSEVQSCAANNAQQMQDAGKRASDPTNHTYVPWVVIDGTLLDYTQLTLRTICNDYTGPRPASCPKNLQATTKPCSKDW